MQITDSQKSKVLHASGLHRSKESYRDHYCINTKVKEGLMTHGSVINSGQSQYYHLTDLGLAEAHLYKKAGIK